MPFPTGLGELIFPYTGPNLAGGAINTIHFTFEIDPEPGDLDGIVTPWQACCDLMSSEWIGQELEAVIGTASGDAHVFSDSVGGAGNLSGTVPNNCATLLRKSTGSAAGPTEGAASCPVDRPASSRRRT